ncbi:MAG TPA: hypothetical protein VF517_11635 [Thermoleophilaceae bacterium]
MAIQRGIEGSEPVHRDVLGPPVEVQEERRSLRTTRMTGGTLACPACDAPVAPGARVLTPADPLACPYCDHAAPTRDFLSLDAPTRPARVAVHVVRR